MTRYRVKQKIDLDILGYLKMANASLEQIPTIINNYFERLGKMSNAVTQEYVDEVCRFVARGINIKVERLRQFVLRNMYNQITIVRVVIDTINIAKQVIEDPLGTIPSFFGKIISPFSTAVRYTVELFQELARLAQNVQRILQVIPPESPNPEINFNAFKLRFGEFSIGAMGSSESLPDPEVLFPAPVNPFGKEAFRKAWEKGKEERETTSKVIYTPQNKKSTVAMEGTIA